MTIHFKRTVETKQKGDEVAIATKTAGIVSITDTSGYSPASKKARLAAQLKSRVGLALEF
jgi:hypothetical protein